MKIFIVKILRVIFMVCFIIFFLGLVGWFLFGEIGSIPEPLWPLVWLFGLPLIIGLYKILEEYANYFGRGGK